MPDRPPQSRKPAPAARAKGPSRSDIARQAQVVALLTPAVRATGLELEDVELRSVGRRLVVRVLVDSERGVSLDEVATASRTVSDLLDGSDVLGDEPYTLEVSSPGVDRPLTLPRHWQRNLGRLVLVTLADGQQVTGRVTSVSDTEIDLEINVKGRTSGRTLAVAHVAKAFVQVEFSRAAAADLDSLEDLDDLDPDDDAELDTDTESDTTTDSTES